MFCPFKPVQQLLQHHLDRKRHLDRSPIFHVIVPLSGFEMMGEETAGMQLLVLDRTLGQDGAHSNVRGANLHHTLTGRVQMGLGWGLW